jgi:hypothetical protein
MPLSTHNHTTCMTPLYVVSLSMVPVWGCIISMVQDTMVTHMGLQVDTSLPGLHWEDTR